MIGHLFDWYYMVKHNRSVDQYHLCKYSDIILYRQYQSISFHTINVTDFNESFCRFIVLCRSLC
jgi:hypothetical protein